MGALKDVMPYAILAGVVAVIYIKRDAIVNWLKGTLVPDSLVTDTDGDNWNDAGTGVIDVNKPLWDGSLSCNAFPSLCGNPPSGQIDTTIPGTTPGQITDATNLSGNPVQTLTITSENMCDYEPFKSSSLCAGRAPITTPGYYDALAGTSNLVTGTAQEAYANAQAIRAAAAARPGSRWTYESVMPLIEADGYTEMQISPVLALGINRYGWDVHYTQDSGPWHKGQIISMDSGGNNPFGNSAFEARMKQAMAYGGA